MLFTVLKIRITPSYMYFLCICKYKYPPHQAKEETIFCWYSAVLRPPLPPPPHPKPPGKFTRFTQRGKKEKCSPLDPFSEIECDQCVLQIKSTTSYYLNFLILLCYFIYITLRKQKTYNGVPFKYIVHSFSSSKAEYVQMCQLLPYCTLIIPHLKLELFYINISESRALNCHLCFLLALKGQ
jgi:hypothetical protein